MNQYLFLRRMRGPIMLLVFGVTAILDEYTGIHYGMSWPLYIIAWGVLKLAENAVLAQNPPQVPGPYSGYQPPAGYGPYPGNQPPQGTPPSSSTAIVPVQDEERTQP
jgi:hypothetical protein